MTTFAGYDSLDVLGTILGVYVALAALATLVGMPWQTTGGVVVMVVQVVGSLLAVGVGVALLYLLYVAE